MPEDTEFLSSSVACLKSSAPKNGLSPSSHLQDDKALKTPEETGHPQPQARHQADFAHGCRRHADPQARIPLTNQLEDPCSEGNPIQHRLYFMAEKATDGLSSVCYLTKL